MSKKIKVLQSEREVMLAPIRKECEELRAELTSLVTKEKMMNALRTKQMWEKRVRAKRALLNLSPMPETPEGE